MKEQPQPTESQRGAPERIHPFTDETLLLTASVGNNEITALLYLFMEEGRPYFSEDLRSTAAERQGDQKAWNPSHANILEYCEKSLLPAGLVKRVQGGIHGGRWGAVTRYAYIKTEDTSIPTAFIGHMLPFSERYPETSLGQLLGKNTLSAEIDSQENHTKNVRPQAIRLKIFHALVTSPNPLTALALAEKIGEPVYVAEKYIRQLTEDAIIAKSMPGQPRGVMLSEKQQVVLEDLLQTLKQFETKDLSYLQKGLETAAEVVADPKRVTALLQTRKEASRRVTGFTSSETQNQVLSIIKTHPHSSTEGVRQLIRERYQRKLSKRNLWRILNQLRQNSVITVAEKTSTLYWRLTRERLPRNRHPAEIRQHIQKLWQAGRYEEALTATGLPDAVRFFYLLHQKQPRLRYKDIDMLLDQERFWTEQMIGRLKNLGIPLPRRVEHKKRPLAS